MKRKLRISLICFVLLSLAGLFGIVLVNYKVKPGDEASSSRIQDLGVTIEKVRYSGYSGEDPGRLEWELEADSATRLKEEDLTVFSDVKVIFFSKDGTTFTLRGRECTYNERTEIILVSGDVTIVTVGLGGNDYKLATDSLKYSTRSKELTSTERVELKSQAMSVTGVGLKMDIDGGKLSILKDVRTVIKDAII
jgi:LPS export ABC transporter protein LptC